MIFEGCQSEPGPDIEIYASGSEVRRAWRSFSPRLDKGFDRIEARDGGEPDGARGLRDGVRRATLLSSSQDQLSPLALSGAYPNARVIVLDAGLGRALDWAEGMGEGRVYALGASTYSGEQRDRFRHTQRLLPLHEVDLGVAVRTAAYESEDAPLWICLHLGLLSPELVPGVERESAGGVPLASVQDALESLDGRRVAGFELVGYPSSEKRYSPVALTAAELLRDNILSWWH